MSSLVMTAILFALKPAQAPVEVPVGKVLVITWSNSPTGPGSAAMRDGQDASDDGVYIHRDTVNWAGAYFMLCRGLDGGPTLTLNTADQLVTMGGNTRRHGAGWVLTTSTAAPFSATFNGSNLPYFGGWGGDYTITIAEAP
jgi:hypothetical protein